MEKHFRIGISLLALIVCALVVGFPVGIALAQVPTMAEPILSDIAVRGQGWAQLQQPEELLEFALALVEATLMTAAIAYHPVVSATRRTKSDYDAPRALFVFSLIGMVVGFLIMHHGYLIGFVLFGLGGLLRFKTDDSASDTMRLILATLIGLCVGLNLPVIALITSASAWVLLYLLGGPANFGLDIQFSDKKKPTTESMLALRNELQHRGIQTISMSRTKFKSNVHFVVTSRGGIRRSTLEREVAQLAEMKGSGISDLHID